MRTPPHLQTESSRESVSPQSCKTNNPRSWRRLPRILIVNPQNHRLESFLLAQFVAQSLRLLLPGNAADTHAVKRSILHHNLLDINGRDRKSTRLNSSHLVIS